jgi:hypothetical protein
MFAFYLLNASDVPHVSSASPVYELIKASQQLGLRVQARQVLCH